MLRTPTPKMLEIIVALERFRPMLEQLDKLEGEAYDSLSREYESLTAPLYAAWRDEWKGETSVPVVPREWPPAGAS